MKLIKKFKKLIIIGVLAMIAYAIYNPSVIDYPPLQEKALLINQTIRNQDIDTQAGLDKMGHVLGSAIVAAKKTPLKASLQNIPDEIVVEDLISQLAQEIKDLPEQQARKIAINYCQQLMQQEASNSAKDKSAKPSN